MKTPIGINALSKTIWIWAMALFLGLLVPWLVQRGMFLDGVTYAAISNNLASGVGSFWAPHYTPTLYPVFYEHPPLVFGLQSLFFRLFGDHFWVERLYSLFTAVGVMGGMLFCLRQVLERNMAFAITAIAVILWISIPQVFWSFRNNMLENTSSVFTLFSVGSFLAYRKRGMVWHVLLGAIFLIASVLSKGPTALFPLVAPLFALLLFRQSKNGFYFYVSYVSVFLLAAILYLNSEGLQSNLSAYLDTQLIPALEGKREITTENRFSIAGKFFLEGLLCFLLIGFAWLKQKKIPYSKPTVFFFLISLSASLPMVVSLKQRSYYLVPAFPFLSMAAALVIFPLILSLAKNWSQTSLNRIRVVGFGAVIMVVLFSVLRFGSYSRNEGISEDAMRLTEEFPRGFVFSTSAADWSDWGFHAILSRKGAYGLDMDHQSEYYITKYPDKYPEGYQKVGISCRELYLFKK